MGRECVCGEEEVEIPDIETLHFQIKRANRYRSEEDMIRAVRVKDRWVVSIDWVEPEDEEPEESDADVVADRSAEVEKYRKALDKINAIRNSIVGAQAVDWSEHIYPLVAALDEAGFKGQTYEEARSNVGMLIEQMEVLEKGILVADQEHPAPWKVEADPEPTPYDENGDILEALDLIPYPEMTEACLEFNKAVELVKGK